MALNRKQANEEIEEWVGPEFFLINFDDLFELRKFNSFNLEIHA